MAGPNPEAGCKDADKDIEMLQVRCCRSFSGAEAKAGMVVVYLWT